MVKTIKVDGMMCPHCEARVREAVSAIPGVSGADVSYKNGTVIVTAGESLDINNVSQAIEKAGYKVVGIE